MTPRLGPQVSFTPKPYDLMKDLKNHDANVTFGQLLQNPFYRNQLKSAIASAEKEKNVNVSQTHVDDKENYTVAKCIFRYKMTPVEVILDSGAAACIITTKLATKLKLQPNKSSDILIVTADGQKQRSLGTITEVPLILQGVPFTVNLQLIESPQETLLLGINQFKSFEARIYFDQDKVRIKHQNKFVESPITCIETSKPFFRILTHDVNDYEEEYEDELLYETELFTLTTQEDSELELVSDQEQEYITLDEDSDEEIDPWEIYQLYDSKEIYNVETTDNLTEEQ